jgi:hypothetical protein
MARHVFRYRSRFVELSQATPERYARGVSTVVPIASSIPIAVASSSHHNYHMQYVQQPSQQPPPLPAYPPAYGYASPPPVAQQYPESYYYDSNGNLIPIAVAVAV